jgi:hypothetical protein
MSFQPHSLSNSWGSPPDPFRQLLDLIGQVFPIRTWQAMQMVQEGRLPAQDIIAAIEKNFTRIKAEMDEMEEALETESKESAETQHMLETQRTQAFVQVDELQEEVRELNRIIALQELQLRNLLGDDVHFTQK